MVSSAPRSTAITVPPAVCVECLTAISPSESSARGLRRGGDGKVLDGLLHRNCATPAELSPLAQQYAELLSRHNGNGAGR